MKSLTGLLKEFQEVVSETRPAQQNSYQFYGSKSFLYLKDAELILNNWSQINRKKGAASLHRCLVNLAKTATALELDLSEIEPTFHSIDMYSLYSKFWDGDHLPFLEQMLYGVNTHIYFTPEWTFERMLGASTGLLKEEIE